MQAHGLVHRLVLIAGLAAITAAPAFAQRCTSGAADDPTVRSPRTTVTAAVTTAPKPGVSTPSRVAALAPVPSPSVSRDSRLKSSPVLKAARPTARPKAAAPQTPATPGMGTLLKWTTGTGRDMSFLFDSDDKTHRAKRIIAGSVRLGCAPEINPFS